MNIDTYNSIFIVGDVIYRNNIMTVGMGQKVITFATVLICLIDRHARHRNQSR